jgi:tyrosyl-tRNA synthetase
MTNLNDSILEIKSELTVDEKYNLITRNLHEVVGGSELRKILEERDPKIYWGTAPTGRIHIGYFVPLLKLADYLKACCKVTVLIADLHAFLDNMKSDANLLDARTDYYALMIKTMLETLDIDVTQLSFVQGSNFQLKQEYTMDVYKLNAMVKLNEAKHAGAEVVKQSDNPTMTGLLYPGLQALDEEYLDVDIQSGGIDQRKIFMFAREYLPKLGYKKRIHLMNGMVPGLRFVAQDESKKTDEVLDKMSASVIDSKIDLLDSKGDVKKKINRTYCLPGDTNDNTPLVLLEKIIFPILDHKGKKFVINRKEKFGGPLTYDSYKQVHDDYASEKLHPGDLKLGLVDTINMILDPIRDIFSKKYARGLVTKAYP